MKKYILEHLNKYPQMEIQDIVKLIYQSEFGGGHLIKDEAESLLMLHREYNSIEDKRLDQGLKIEKIGSNICRIYLEGLKSQLSLETLNQIFIRSAESIKKDTESFEGELSNLHDMALNKEIPFDADDLATYLKKYKSKGYPMVSHSRKYRELYKPSYRVINQIYADYIEAFIEIDKLQRQSKEPILIAIDGMSGSGKSLLGSLISNIYNCNLFHMDDFFLRPEQRTKERQKEIGGNVDYERFNSEILSPLKNNQEVEYQIYDCVKQRLEESCKVSQKPINIIEGSYSHHPYFGDSYDLKIFLKIDKKTQKQRILNRNGAEMLKRFEEEWIPKENSYFSKFKILEKSDLVIHYAT